MMLQVAEMMAQQGDNNARWLANLAQQLATFLGIQFQPTDSTIPNTNEAAVQARTQFLAEVLTTISQSRGDAQVVYPLLQANLDKLG